MSVLNRRSLIAMSATGALAGIMRQRASARTGTSEMAEQKTKKVVLVHGAFTDGNCWSEVILRLGSKGYTVTAAQIPLTSLADDIAYIKNVLSRQSGPVVLVGHSWGGMVITEAGLSPSVTSLVYVSALVPDENESAIDLQNHGWPSSGMEGARPDDRNSLWFDPGYYGPALAGDLPPERIQLLAATQKPIAATSFGEKVVGTAWKKKPSWYLLSGNDRALAPELQSWMAHRSKAAITEVFSSHMSLISHADVVTGLIEDAAQA